MPDTTKREVPITMETTIIMIYDLKNKILKFSCFIQRDNAAGYVVDTVVQAKVNLPKLDSTE